MPLVIEAFTAVSKRGSPQNMLVHSAGFASPNFHKTFYISHIGFTKYFELPQYICVNKSNNKMKSNTMIKSLSAGSVIFASLLFTGCAGTAQIEKAKDADMGHYKTYSWVTAEKNETDKSTRHKQIAEQNIRYAVDEQLQKNGLRHVKANPDVLVSTDFVVERNNQQKSDAVYTQPTTRSYYNPRSGKINTFYYPSEFAGYNNYSVSVKAGTVTVTLIDAKTDKAVWQGWATKEMNTANISEKDIDKNVKSIFKKFDTGN
jgi:PBP1b-binding outer membrane lipoprotein LpoB